MNRIFNKIFNIGIVASTTDSELKKIRIINGISFFCCLVMLVATIMVLLFTGPFVKPDWHLYYQFFTGTTLQKAQIIKEVKLIFPLLDILGALLSGALLYLNYRGKYRLSMFLFCIFTLLFVLLFFWLIGYKVLFFFFIPVLMPVIFYDRKWHYILFWLFNIALGYFVIALKYNMDPENFFYTNNNAQMLIPYIINLSVVIVLLFFIVNHFKAENMRNEAVLQQKNMMLQSQSEEIRCQRDEIGIQKKEIERKSKNLTASIHYAQQIQEAMLPAKEVMKKYFNDYMVFFQPCNVVSGDFYFVKEFKNKIYIAVADCTGHGVPGAFMSILGITLLNELIQKPELKNAAQIIDALQEHIKIALQIDDNKEEQHDGMDIGMVVLNKNDNTANYAGINMPLWIFRNEKRIEINADKMLTGMYFISQNFTNHDIDLQKNDKIYLFTDGFYSQFKQETGETFKLVRFKNLLQSVSDLPFANQHEQIKTFLNHWKGNQEQTDDILILGFTVK